MSKTGRPPFGDRRRNRHGLLKESVGFSAAEGVSMGVSLLAVGVADKIAPDAVKHATSFVAKTLIEPRLDWIEKNVQKICKIEDCKPDKTQSRKERSENIARALVLFAPAWALSMWAKVETRKRMNEHFGIKDPPTEKTGNKFLDNFVYKQMSPYAWKVFIADEAVHYGSLIYLNTSGAEYTSDMINATSKMLQKQVGMSKRKADDLSSMAMIWELPNILGLGAGLGMIAGKHKLGWGDRRAPQR